MTRTMRHLLLGIFVLVSGIYLFSQPDDSKEDLGFDDLGTEERPAAYVEGARFVFFEKDGHADFDLHSSKALYYEKSARIIVSEPRLLLDRGQQETIHLSARSGHYDTQAQTLELSGEVILKRELPGASAMTLETEILKLDKLSRFISTDQVVTIRQGGHELEAKGLQANLDSKKIELLSRVRGHYVLGASDG